MSWCCVRGGRLGDEVTSQTQAIQSIADKIAKPVKLPNASKIVVLYFIILDMMYRRVIF
jgi:hypothetical protein